jgi:hypothetical protein
LGRIAFAHGMAIRRAATRNPVARRPEAAHWRPQMRVHFTHRSIAEAPPSGHAQIKSEFNMSCHAKLKLARKG